MSEERPPRYFPDDKTKIRADRCFDFSMVNPHPRRSDIACALDSAWQMVVRAGLDSIEGCMMAPVRLE